MPAGKLLVTTFLTLVLPYTVQAALSCGGVFSVKTPNQAPDLKEEKFTINFLPDTTTNDFDLETIPKFERPEKLKTEVALMRNQVLLAKETSRAIDDKYYWTEDFRTCADEFTGAGKKKSYFFDSSPYRATTPLY